MARMLLSCAGIFMRKIPDPNKIDYIIWLQTAFLGDIVLLTGSIKLAYKVFPAAKHMLITNQVGKEALKGFPFLHQVSVLEKSSAQFFGSLNKIKAGLKKQGISSKNSVLLQAHLSTRSTFVANYLNLPYVTFRESSFSLFATKRVARIACFHESIRSGLLLEALGIERQKILKNKPFLPLSDEEYRNDFIPREFEGYTTIAIAPGSVWGTKKWPREHFIQLAFLLLKNKHVLLLLIGSKQESALCNAIFEAITEKCKMGSTSVLNLAGKTSLQDLNYIFPRLSLLICNDSSPMHYGSAFNTPTLALFGATVPQMGFGPLADQSKSIGLEGLSCRPCSDHGPKTCPLGHFQCMQNLKPQLVYQNCRQILEARGKKELLIQ